MGDRTKKGFGVIEFSGEANKINVAPPLHQTGFLTILAGNPGSGKTNTALQLLIKDWAYQVSDITRVSV